MITFSEQIKEELCHNNYEKRIKFIIFSSYFINRLKLILTSNGPMYSIETNYSFIARFLIDCLKTNFKIMHTVSYSNINKFNGKRIYNITFAEKDFIEIKKIINDCTNTKIIDNFTIKENMGFLIGSFLSGGSISDVTKPIYHLEIRTNNRQYLRNIQKVILSFNLSATMLKRKYSYVIYIKKASEISDFLKCIGAINSMYKLEDTIISRDLSNQVHRLNNLDVSNINKSTKAGESQVEMIKKIINTKFFKKQNEKFRHFCNIRINNPSASLSEISKIFMEKYKIHITRTGINHYIMKIKKYLNNK